MHKKEKIIIVGAGLCGSLLAIRMAQQGFEVVLYEKRWDMRKKTVDAGRSINLALSARGLMSLERAGLKERVLTACIPMRGRQVHPQEGSSFFSPYSGRPEDYINSVSRPGLNQLLIEEADKYDNIRIHFDCAVTRVDLENAKIVYRDVNGKEHHDEAAIVIGTDGAGSVIRRSMSQQSGRLLFNYSQNFLRHGYKELSILPDPDGNWQLKKEALHIWPRGSFMIIALPNLDGSFTLTMFHPYGGELGFDALEDREKRREFFETYYPTLLSYIPHYQEEYEQNPVSTLGTIKCYPWQAYGKSLIMGDASHAIVPFYGQGMNASLEDVRVFDELLEVHGNNWAVLFQAFQDARKPNADAIADLAIDNFYEMRDHVDDLDFMRKRKIERQLEERFPAYYSKYSLVTFQPELPYEKAMLRGRKQDELLLKMCQADDFEQIPLEHFYQQLMSLS